LLSLSSTIPGGDIDYARINIRQKYYQPISAEI
jgi:outer membrane protein assembly factor BamA